ncbi:MAG TPA: hypothetical protein VM843_05330 [Flavisolibacter sp.]|jgi:hypothetical protein|nr:hypothetical protein [Flavisolibacter sp.]
MQELIQRISLQSGLSPEKALEALNAVSGFVKEKYPLFSSTVDSLLGTQPAPKE